MAILVTGGAGFIGSHVVDALLKRGEQVVCIDELNAYYDPVQKINNIQSNLGNKNFFFYARDVCESLDAVFVKFKIDKIIHLAARAGVRPSLEHPLHYVQANVYGTVNVLEAARKYGVKKLVFGSTSSVYGVRNNPPFKETDNTDSPESPYAASKKSCEQFCKTYSKLYGISVSCLRFFSVYGPRGRPDMAPYKFARLIAEGKEIPVYGDGFSRRDWTFVSDVVAAIIAAAEREYEFEIFNVGNAKTVELSYLIELLEKHLGRPARKKMLPAQLGDVPLTNADVSKAKRMLGWEPKVSIEEGIGRFIEWFKEQKLESQPALEEYR